MLDFDPGDSARRAIASGGMGGGAPGRVHRLLRSIHPPTQPSSSSQRPPHIH